MFLCWYIKYVLLVLFLLCLRGFSLKRFVFISPNGRCKLIKIKFSLLEHSYAAKYLNSEDCFYVETLSLTDIYKTMRKQKYFSYSLEAVSFIESPIDLCVCDCECVCSVMSNSSQPHGLKPAPPPSRPLYLWNFPGKNTRVDYHFLCQGVFLTQGSNPCLLHCRKILYYCATWEALQICTPKVNRSGVIWG